MPNYWIPMHVHVCISQDIVWLDSRNDKYLSVAGSESHILAQLVHGWPASSETASITTEERQALALALEAKGLLTRHVAEARRYVPPAFQSPSYSMETEGNTEQVAIRWHHVAHMAAACLMTCIVLRVGRVHFAIRGLENRKSAHVTSAALNSDAIRGLVRAFKRLRLYFYTPREKCLFDSLVLMRFLYSYVVVPTWVIGVTSRPFHAHCWVQQDGIVWNGEADYVNRFSPILVI